MTFPTVPVTVFTSIPDIAETLRRSSPSLHLEVITDVALGGYGGTVSFNPSILKAATRITLKNAQILIAEPAVLAALVQFDTSALSNLKWCQSTYAGVDPLFNSGLNLPLSFQLTRFAGKFGPPIAEWCLARIISHERKFALVTADQYKRAFAGSKEVTRYRYLRDLTLSILGCGDIGMCIAQTAKAFGMRVVGYVRTPRSSEGAAIDEYTTELSTALREADYLVSVLPSTPETRGLLGGETLAPAGQTMGGRSPVFLNVGRGDVIDEASIIHALDESYISAAILDVFDTEPLPDDSALWRRSDVVVSPHVSGITRADDVPEVFLENYQRYVSGDELLYQVDWSKGY